MGNNYRNEVLKMISESDKHACLVYANAEKAICLFVSILLGEVRVSSLPVFLDSGFPFQGIVVSFRNFNGTPSACFVHLGMPQQNLQTKGKPCKPVSPDSTSTSAKT